MTNELTPSWLYHLCYKYCEFCHGVLKSFWHSCHFFTRGGSVSARYLICREPRARNFTPDISYGENLPPLGEPSHVLAFLKSASLWTVWMVLFLSDILFKGKLCKLWKPLNLSFKTIGKNTKNEIILKLVLHLIFLISIYSLCIKFPYSLQKCLSL